MRGEWGTGGEQDGGGVEKESLVDRKAFEQHRQTKKLWISFFRGKGKGEGDKREGLLDLKASAQHRCNRKFCISFSPRACRSVA